MISGWSQQIERISFATFNRGKRIVAISSPQAGAGVTSTCRHLARGSALAGVRTLLVDLSGRAETRTYNGSSWLPGESGVGQAVVRDPMGFDRLVARFDPSTRFLFNNVRLLRQTLVDDLRRYDAIVVDVPRVPTPDDERINGAAAIAACDAAVLVCMSGRVSRTELEAARDALANAQVELLGIVLNEMHNPTLGAELARQARKLNRVLPKLSGWLERNALASPLLD